MMGHVSLVGAGPGDPALLTRKAVMRLRAADLVLYDALVDERVLRLARRAQRFFVGKRAGRHALSQTAIHAVMIRASKRGRRVVRLKGGDPAVFGRAMEELVACRAAGVPVHICPGITAASAAVASLGTSLTLRGLARRLTLVTAHTRKGQVLALDWQALADPAATLAVYMGKGAAGEVARGLLGAGLAPDTPVALVENASLPDERLFRTRLDLLAIAARTALGDGPALLLIGEAMAPHPAAHPALQPEGLAATV